MARRRGRKPGKPKTWILQLDHDDPEKELDFEVRWQLSLSKADRFRMMFDKSRMIRNMLETHGHSTPPQIIQRASG